MGSDKAQTPVPKVSSQPSGDFKGKRKEPAEEHLETGPSHGITKENSDEFIVPETTTQKQQRQMDRSDEKENTQEEID